MFPVLALFVAVLSGTVGFAAAAPGPPAPVFSVDLEGNGSPESVTAAFRARKLHVEIRSAAGKVLASADAPAPPAAAGAPVVSFTAGALGSSGSLVEVVATAGSQECRSVWRYRENALSRVPLSGLPAAALSDCGPAAQWAYSWDRPSEDAPTQYRRERTHETPDGPNHQIQSFRYAGFRLELDPSRSKSEIRGIAIPTWYGARLYRKNALDNLYARFNLAALRKLPRLQIRTEPDTGIFAMRIDRSYGEWLLPVTALEKGTARNEVVLMFGPGSNPGSGSGSSSGSETDSGSPGRRARVTLPGGGGAPSDVLLSGFDSEVDGLYGPAMRLANGALRIYETAEDELASNGLVGGWTGGRGESVTIALASTEPVFLEIGKESFRLEMQGAPEGLDALLVPRGGANPSGIVLRGPNAFERVPVRCEKKGEAPSVCRVAGKGETLHRLGARINVR